MDNNIVQTVYKTLEACTEQISRSIAECNELEEKINSGRYTQQTLEKEVYPKRNELRQKVHNDSAAAIQAAKTLIEQYREDAVKLNNLDPTQLTDDIKLLQSGIVLMPGDIQAILERNKDNRTMTQIILRYAKEHGIDTGGTYYIGGQYEEETARTLDSILSYYEYWIDKPDAKRMLDKFFGVQNA